MGKVLNVTYASSLTDLCKYNSSFDSGVLRVCYPGENRNKSFISKQALEKCLPSIYNVPIVCNYDRESDTLGGHDIEIVRDADGNIQLVNATQPVGVIPESAKYWFEEYEEDDGTVHEYLYVEALIWKRQEAYQKIKKDGIVAHSMEINVKDGEMIDDVYHIKDFEFTALALIGVEPCFESSSLELFSEQNFKQQFTKMMQDFKECFKQVNTSEEDDNTYLQNDSTEGGKEALEEKMNLLAEFGVNVEDLDFSIDDLSVEELRAKLDAAKKAPEEAPDDDSDHGKFALTKNVTEELRRMLSEVTITDEWGEYRRYWYVDCDFEINEVYCYDAADDKLYGFTYTLSGDAVTINFDCKKRKKYAIVDFEGEEQAPVMFTSMIEEMTRSMKEKSELQKKYQTAADNISSMQQELEVLQKFKKDTETDAEKEKRKSILDQFEDLAGVEAFEKLCENCMEYDVDTLEEKCYAIRGRNNPVKFSLEDKTPRIKVDKTETTAEPYGGVFVKYGIVSNKD